MKKYLCSVALACLLAACAGNPENTSAGLTVIDVETAAGNLQELKLSQLGNRVRYVPLETNDSCFVGQQPSIQICGNHILVTFDNQCLSFDRQSGRFTARIGHVGEDPEGYATPSFTYNEDNGLLYFVREPDQLQKYDVQGHYHGPALIPTPPARPNEFLASDSLLIGYYRNFAQANGHSRALLLFDESGRALDSIASQLPALPLQTIQNVQSINVWKLGLSGILLTRFADGSVQANITSDALWACDGQIRFKEEFSDTVYNVTGHRLQPAIAFHTGRYHFPLEARTEGAVSKDKLLPLSVLESPQRIFFQCSQGIYETNTETFNGIYDKQTGTTSMAPEKDGLTDDLNGFLPFRPVSCSTQGEYIALLWPEDILPWLDEHPEAKDNPALAPLLKVGEEDNPVAVIVTQE